MKTALVPVLLFVALGGMILMLATRTKAAAKPSHSGEEAWSYKAGRGVTLNETASKSLGITVAEVQSADIIPEREAVTVQLYRAAPRGSAPGGKAMGSFFLPAGEAERLAPGQAFELRENGSVFAAAVTSAKPPAEGHGGLAEVLSEISDPKGELRAGDFLEARIARTKDARSGVAAIPLSAVVDSVRGPFVYVANDTSFLRTPVKLGAAQDGVVEVLDGLFDGDVVVTNGSPGLWMIELQAVNGGKGCGAAH